MLNYATVSKVYENFKFSRWLYAYNFQAIFEEAGSTLTPNQSSIIVAGIQLLANFTTMVLVEKAGRKLLYMISIFGTTVGLLLMGNAAKIIIPKNINEKLFKYISTIQVSSVYTKLN